MEITPARYYRDPRAMYHTSWQQLAMYHTSWQQLAMYHTSWQQLGASSWAAETNEWAQG